MDLPAAEQAIVDGAVHDGEGWTISHGLPDDCIEALASKGLIRLRNRRWQLTPAGFARSAMFRQRAGVDGPLIIFLAFAAAFVAAIAFVRLAVRDRD